MGMGRMSGSIRAECWSWRGIWARGFCRPSGRRRGYHIQELILGMVWRRMKAQRLVSDRDPIRVKLMCSKVPQELEV